LCIFSEKYLNFEQVIADHSLKIYQWHVINFLNKPSFKGLQNDLNVEAMNGSIHSATVRYLLQ